MFLMLVFLAMMVCFLAIDLVWLGLAARHFYQKHLGYLLRSRPNWAVAILFYLIYVAGILVFVVLPALTDESFAKAATLGAMFGCVTYATYDLTNHATIKGWPWIVSVVDIGWGATLCTIVASCGYLTGSWLR